MGPHRGGRVVAVAGHPTDPMVFYFGACAGGVWKTTDGGTYWVNVSDGFFKTAAVGAIAVASSDPNVIYAGMGETAIRGNVSHGDGVYRSSDGGKTWAHLGLADTRHISRIRIHPENPDVVYVAALGHAWGPNRERGLYRSVDGGRNWEQILFRSDKAGAIDLSMDPNNPRTLYVAFWEAQRSPHGLSSGGPDSSLYRSTDGGDTWTELTNNEGLPKGVKGKIGVAVSPAKRDRVWALVEAEDGALFRSDDAGETWQRLSEEGQLRMRAWYYMHLYADPQDPETCWVLNLRCWKSVDGGRTFRSVPTPHGDNHDLWIDPHNPQRMIEGNDGGACVSFNGGASWSTIYNQPTAQLYHVTTDNQVPYRLYASQQDNTAITIPSLSMNGVISTTEWYVPGGGESGYIAVRPDNPNVVFGGAIGSGFGNGLLFRYDHHTQHWRNITAWPVDQSMGEGAEALKYRFQWTFPIVISPHDPKVLYVGANQLLRSTDEGMSWEPIGPDLTRNDPTKLGPSGGPITKDNTGAEVYCTIFAFVESPHEKGVFWAGTDDGLVHLSRDGGQNWENVTPPDLPEWSLISIIDVSPHDPATAYLAATRYKLDDWRPYLFKTNDYGKTWQSITNGIPADDFTRTIREDPDCRGLLYAGTETRIYVSFDDGASWQSLQTNLPVAPIYDLVRKDHQLIAATHGRSLWILDDVSPLQQLVDRPELDSVRLFKPAPTTRFNVEEWSSWDDKDREPGLVQYGWAGPIGVGYQEKKQPDGTVTQDFLDAGKNPPGGVIVTYYLPDAPEGEVTLTFLDAAGNEIRTFSSKKPDKPDQTTSSDEQLAAEVSAGGPEGAEAPGPAGTQEAPDEKEPKVPKQAGTNRFVWNLRYPSAVKVPGHKDRELDYFVEGPVAVPGHYQVRLSVGDESHTEPFEVVRDPRLHVTQEDLQAQFDLLLAIRDKISETHDAVNTIRDLRQQIEGWERRVKGRPDAQTVLEAAGSLKKGLKAVEAELIQEKADSPLQYPAKLNVKISSLVFAVGMSETRPTRQSYEAFEELSGRVDTQLRRLEEIVETGLADFNRLIRETDVPALIPQKTTQKEPAMVGSR